MAMPVYSSDMGYLRRFVLILTFVLAMVACNKDEEIAADAKTEIVLSNDTGIYSVKVNREIVIAPLFRHLDGGTVEWIVDGEIVASGPQLRFSSTEVGAYYFTIRVTNRSGITREEIRINVIALAEPVISMMIPEGGLRMQLGKSLKLAPEYLNDDDGSFTVAWSVDGAQVAESVDYVFTPESTGVYRVGITASNDDGEARLEFDVTVSEDSPCSVTFPSPSYRYSSTTRYTFVGRPVYLAPDIEGIESPEYSWSVDGENVDCHEAIYRFVPSAPGSYDVSVEVSGRAVAGVTVVCVDVDESQRQRVDAGGARSCSRVWEYTPAPGQFINDPATMSGVTDWHDAAAKAFTMLDAGQAVSLGAFGGCLIVGFDHSVTTSGDDWDFSIGGNQFESSLGASSEPGIVWVMQDVNGNGEPDDEWYELRGSDYDATSTLHDYSVTYYRPSAGSMNVLWSDSRGMTGRVDYLTAYHAQSSYYPAWVDAISYTLRGSRLAERNYFDAVTGFWSNPPYDWGYADNVGSDLLNDGMSTGFKISNAVYPDGSSVNLQYVDFIKIQSAVQSQSGTLGEVSTEITSIRAHL